MTVKGMFSRYCNAHLHRRSFMAHL